MILNILKKQVLKRKWRKNNRHNFTTYFQIFGEIKKIHIGNFTYGEIYVSSPNIMYELYIGHCCSIGGEVRFLLGVEHPINKISSYPFKANVLKIGIDAISKGNIVIEDDVWIGQGCIILSGVHIGQGAVIAAGAIVTHNIPPYAIVGGVPAKVIKFRFKTDVIDYMLTLDYSCLTEEMIRKHIDELYIPIDVMELNDIKRLYNWFPKKNKGH